MTDRLFSATIAAWTVLMCVFATHLPAVTDAGTFA